MTCARKALPSCIGILFRGMKVLFLSLSELTEKKIFHCMCKSWRNLYHCSFPLIILTIQDGCLSISETLKSLPYSIKDEFEKQGNWVLSKTNNTFSAISIDEAHEAGKCLRESFCRLYWAYRKPFCIQTLDVIRARAC